MEEAENKVDVICYDFDVMDELVKHLRLPKSGYSIIYKKNGV